MKTDERPATLDGWFFRSARRHPDVTALEVDGVRLTYCRMAELAERLACVVATAAAEPPRAVGIVASRSIAAYVGHLAALRAGAAAAPVIGPVSNRTIASCAAAHVGVIVTDTAGASHGVEVGSALDVPVITLTSERSWDDLPSGAYAGAAARPADPDDVAYILFTSGSTGRPKGVPIRHRQLTDYVDYCARRYAMVPGCRTSQTFELTFDPSVFDMYVTWAGGATLVVPQRDDLVAPASFVSRHAITHWFSVPSVISLARRLRCLSPNSMPTLCWSLFAGEQLTLDQAQAWAWAAPRSVIENLYGPTEVTVTCTGFRLPRDPARWPKTSNGTVPIGRPYPHLEVRVRGETGDSREGELWVRGSQRFAGYLDPEQNTTAFAPADPNAWSGIPGDDDWYRTGDRVRWENGELVHLGRTDDQIKVSGFRVEPAEVECALRAFPGILEAAVVGVDSGTGRLQLLAAYSGEPRLEAEVIEHLRHHLPHYMVPERVRHVAELPVNANGKVDRKRLRELWSSNGG